MRYTALTQGEFMKYLLALSLLLPLSAFAKTTTFTCDGREITKGGQGRTGTMVVAATTDDRWHTSDGKQLLSALNVEWFDETLVAPGKACGVELATNDCTTFGYNTNGGLSYSIRQDCGVTGFDTRGIPHRESELTVVLNSRADHGRFSCVAHDAKRHEYIQLSNCH
jgi:hypothetical protein